MIVTAVTTLQIDNNVDSTKGDISRGSGPSALKRRDERVGREHASRSGYFGNLRGAPNLDHVTRQNAHIHARPTAVLFPKRCSESRK